GRGRVGDEQLAGHRQLLQKCQRGALDPLRRPGRDRLPWDGEARAGAADRTGTAVLVTNDGSTGSRMAARTIVLESLPPPRMVAKGLYGVCTGTGCHPPPSQSRQAER